MSQITVYNTSTQTEDDIKINVFDNDSFNAFIDQSISSFVYEGITWYVTKTQSTDFTVLELSTSQNINNLNVINGMFDSIELGGRITEEDCMQLVLEDIDGNYIYQKNNSTSYPYLRYNHSYNPGQSVNSYNISANRSSGVSYGVALGAGGDAFTYGKINAFEVPDSELSFYGFTAILANGSGTTITLCRASGISSTNYVEVEASVGDKGFKPIAEITKNPRGGGKKSGQSPDYATDTLTQPDEPNESVASLGGSGFLTVYDITKGNLANLCTALFSETLLQALYNLFYNPLDFIIGLNIFPYTPHIGSSQPIKLGVWECSHNLPNGLGVDANGFVLSKQFRQIDFGTLTVNEMFESYLDYDSSSFTLYLPFIGEIDIPVSEVMDGSINVKYTIDYFTGMCVANVLCTKNIALSDTKTVNQYSQHSYQGNCAVQVPITSVSYGNLVGSLINAASAGLKGGVAGAVMSVAGDAVSGGFKPTVQTKGTISANAGFCAILYPYITVTRPITAEPENFQEVMGYPSYVDATLASCQGLCVCDNINLAGLAGATESEIERIKQLCKEGIYI